MTNKSQPANVWNAPSHLVLLTPVHVTRKRGVYGVKWGARHTLRMTVEQSDLIEQEAKALGIPVAIFLRWCAVEMARKLHEQRTGEKSAVQP